MNCTNCGTEVSENANVCSNCGHVLKSGFVTNSTQQPTPQQTTEQAPPQQQSAEPPAPNPTDSAKKKNKGCGIFLVIVILIGLVFGALYIDDLVDKKAEDDALYDIFEATEAVRVENMNATGEANSENLRIWAVYIRDTDNIRNDFVEVYNVAAKSNRIDLPEQIGYLKDLVFDAKRMDLDSRYFDIHDYFIEMLQSAIDGFEDWHAGGTDYETYFGNYQRFSDGWTDELNKIEH